MSESFLYASSQDWPAADPNDPVVAGYDWNLACPLELHQSFSIQAVSCDLELNQYGEWAAGGGGLRIANVTGAGKLSIKDTCVEMQGSFHIGGNAEVSWDGNDDGYSSSPFPTFEIGADATGSLTVSNAAWVRPTGWGINMPVGFVSRDITPAHPHSLFTVTLDDVQLMDFTWDVTVATSPHQTDPPRADTPPPPSGYIPIARGVDLQLSGGGLTMVQRLCTNASLDLNHDVFCQGPAGDHPVVAGIMHVRPGNENLLRVGPAAVDVSGAALPTAITSAEVSSAAGPVAGWTVLSSGTCTSHTPAGKCGLVRLDQKDGLPLTPQSAAAAAAPTKTCFNSTTCTQPGIRVPFRPTPAVGSGLRLQSVTGGATSILNGQLTPSVQATAVEPARQYVLRGFVRSNGIGTIRFLCNWLTFSGTKSGDPLARFDLAMNSSWIGFHGGSAVWEPLLLRLESPGDAASVRVGATAEDGAVLDLFDLRLS